ncbi:uncharacterized protein TNCV_1309331 [Trichonephila clavipes]|nr:uncharacterized protein TNCV_1309331 [Trichonephila clavipes]
MGDFTYVKNADTHYMYGRANGNGRVALRMYHAQFSNQRMHGRRIFKQLHRQLHETHSFHVIIHSTSDDAGQRKAIRCPSLEESILNVVADRPESSTRAVAHHGLGLNLGEVMDVRKCIVPLRHVGALNSRRAASPLDRFVKEEETWEAPGRPQGVSPLNWGVTEPKRNVTCMVLKTTANNRCTIQPFATMNFVVLDLAHAIHVALVKTTTKIAKFRK